MTNKYTKQQYIDLINLVNKYSYEYHVLDNPTIKDSVYDSLYKEIVNIESSHSDWIEAYSPTQRVGDKPATHFLQVEHLQPMLSLSNGFNNKDLIDFYNRNKIALTIENIEYVIEPKYDGLALNLLYRNGILELASTRGNGIIGEDVTSNVKTIKSIPLKLNTLNPPETIEIRGEIILTKENFLKLNNEQKNKGLKLFTNARNAAAGSLRQLNPKVTKDRNLTFYPYSLGFTNLKNKPDLHSEVLNLIHSYGFLKNKYISVSNDLQYLLNAYNDLNNNRNNIPFDIDGIVYKINSYKLQQEIGYTSRVPKYAIAYKFEAEEVSTIVEDIIMQVGRTGVITPVAKVKTIFVGGVNVSSITLHNELEIKKKDIRIGDTVIVKRAGDVIPMIVEVIKDLRDNNSIPFMMPDTCSSCNSKLINLNNEVAIRCPNEYNCVDQIKEKLKHFVSKNAMNINGLGDKLINLLVDNKIISNFQDIYCIDYQALLSLPNISIKTIDNLKKSINKSKTVKLDNFIFALGIRHVGLTTAKSLASNFKNIKEILKINKESIINIPDIGEIVSNSIVTYFNNKDNILLIDSLLKHVSIYEEIKEFKNNVINNFFKDKNVVITGSFLNYNRVQMYIILIGLNANVFETINKKIDCIIVGTNPGSKLNKARNINILEINEEKFTELITNF